MGNGAAAPAGIRAGSDDLVVTFLAQGEQTGQEVAARLSTFLAGARVSLDLACYDFRLGDASRASFSAALRERAAAGVAVRVVYDADKPPAPILARGMDPAPGGTGRFIQALGVPWRRIGGPKLMHHKYIVRDAGTAAARVWTGSTNFTDDAWTLQENNILQIASPTIAAAYAHNFTELWAAEAIGTSGAFDTEPVELAYRGTPLQAQVLFSPGRGPAIDYEVAYRVATARRRVRVCSMLLNSSALLAALDDLLDAGQVEMSGIYDQTQQEGVFTQWQDLPRNRWKIGAVREIVAEARLVGKVSTPYRPDTPHDFMHNKVLVVDDTVITGSYNFSRSAEANAENILLLTNPALADEYSQYIDHLMAKYGGRR